MYRDRAQGHAVDRADNAHVQREHRAAALNTFLLRQADDTAPRVFIGSNEGSGKSATFDEARQFALEILARTDGYGG